LEFERLFVKFHTSEVMGIPEVRAMLFHVDGQTDRQTHVARTISTFCECTIMLKKGTAKKFLPFHHSKSVCISK
jgi:hypothetical protein